MNYKQIYEKGRELDLPKKVVKQLIEEFKKEFIRPPLCFGELLEVLE